MSYSRVTTDAGSPWNTAIRVLLNFEELYGRKFWSEISLGVQISSIISDAYAITLRGESPIRS